MEASTDPAVLVLSGPPGVGKTTVARVLAERSDRAVHLEADVFFDFIRSGYVEPWKPESREQNEVVMGIAAAAATEYAAAGYFTIVDGIVIPGWFLEPMRDSLGREGHSVDYAVLRAPLSVCAERAANRKRQPFGDGDVIGRLCRSFADLGKLEEHAVDLGAASPEEAADILEQKLAAGLLRV